MQLLLLWLPTVAARGVWRAQWKRLSVSDLIKGGSIDCNKRGFEELYFSTLTQNERQEITRVSWISIWLTYRRKMFSLSFWAWNSEYSLHTWKECRFGWLLSSSINTMIRSSPACSRKKMSFWTKFGLNIRNINHE